MHMFAHAYVCTCMMTTSAVLLPILDEIEEDIDDEVFTDLTYHSFDDEVIQC